MEVELYSEQHKTDWDAFVAGSKQGTFLFLRDYIEYHADRFQDFSLIVRDKLGNVAAILPANRSGDRLVSHAGLTYGGFVTASTMKVPLMHDVLESVLAFLGQNGIRRLAYKTIPHIYHTLPAEEDRYCLFLMGAQLYREDVLSVIDYRQPISSDANRRRSLQKAEQNGLKVRETDDFGGFWRILTDNLGTHHGVKPVHSLDEILLLSRHFPENIKLYGSYRGDTIMAGVVVYLSRNVCHVQYNAASEGGRKVGAQDAVLDYLTKEYRESKRFFDFGISTENEGRLLNKGLVDYKESFGARTVLHSFYQLDVPQTSNPDGTARG